MDDDLASLNINYHPPKRPEFKKLIAWRGSDGHINGLEGATVCPICQGTNLALNGNVLVCLDSGTVIAEIADSPPEASR